ncbi:glycerate kinase type-2 family protein [Phreatobacter sp.]|uniref:glycerate kinase type-2 family protein n=1 Tax=Phreatobacter sp. TaxID=1966341 RepID=UPI003F6FACB0
MTDHADPRAFLLSLGQAAIKAALPDRIADHLPPVPEGRTVVVGAGKAAASMAAAFEKLWPAPLEGTVVTRYGHAVPSARIEVLEASHPVPDEAGLSATRRILSRLEGLTGDDLVVALISGGGSALLALPGGDLSLEDLKAVNAALLASGADITAMNCVRKHVSAIAGGRLAAAAHPAKVVTLAISDVPGDDPAVIASGPTVPDPTTREEALAIVARYRMDLPAAVMRHLQSPASESPKPGHPAFAAGSDVRLIARPVESLRAAARIGEAAGLRTLVLGDTIEGEARDVAQVHAALARSVLEHGLPFSAPLLILSGGETTVTLPKDRPTGRGGRNSEFALAFAAAIQPLAPALRDRIHAMAIDTDGIDGVEANAGAVVTPALMAAAEAGGLSLRAFLDRHDGFGFFAAVDGLIVTGPTHTNVNDIRAVLIV